MKSTNTRKIEKIKKKHGVLAIFAFLLTSFVATMMLSYFVYSLVFYLLEAKLTSEYESISYMARIYEQSLADGYEGDVWQVLDQDGREYIIRNNSGELVVGKEDNTCSEEGDVLMLGSIQENVELYVDKQYPYVTLNEKGEATVLLNDLLKYIRDHQEDPELFFLIDDAEVHEDITNVLIFVSDSYLRLPVWLGMKVADGEETFIGKGFIYIRMTDVSIIMITTMILGTC